MFLILIIINAASPAVSGSKRAVPDDDNETVLISPEANAVSPDVKASGTKRAVSDDDNEAVSISPEAKAEMNTPRKLFEGIL